MSQWCSLPLDEKVESAPGDIRAFFQSGALLRFLLTDWRWCHDMLQRHCLKVDKIASSHIIAKLIAGAVAPL